VHIKPFAAYADDPDKIIKKRTKKLKNREESESIMPKELMSLADLLNRGGASYTNEQIAQMVSRLSDEDKGLLALRYTEGVKLNSDQTNRFYGTLVPKMKRMLKNPDFVPKNRPSLQTDNGQKEKPVSELTTPSVQLSGDPVNTEIQGVEEDESHVSVEPEVSVNPCSAISDNQDISKEEYQKMLELLRMPTFASMLDQFTPKQAIIVALKLGYVDNKCFSTSSIAGFLEIEEQEVVTTTKEALLMYRDSFVNFIDVAIQETTGSPVKKIGSNIPNNN